MAGNAGGSYEDLSTLEDVVPGEPMGTSGLMALHKLENLRIDKLKQLRKPAASKGLNLPPIPGVGEIWGGFSPTRTWEGCGEVWVAARGFHGELKVDPKIWGKLRAPSSA